jgi:predicted LPLAT superfamily acyltransferase
LGLTQNNLGEAYRNRIRGEKAENIELAIASYTAALTVYTRDAFPEKWARRKIIWQQPTVTELGERKQRISNWRSHLTLLH